MNSNTITQQRTVRSRDQARAAPASTDLILRDGAFTLWDGKPAISG